MCLLVWLTGGRRTSVQRASITIFAKEAWKLSIHWQGEEKNKRKWRLLASILSRNQSASRSDYRQIRQLWKFVRASSFHAQLYQRLMNINCRKILRKPLHAMRILIFILHRRVASRRRLSRGNWKDDKVLKIIIHYHQKTISTWLIIARKTQV